MPWVILENRPRKRITASARISEQYRFSGLGTDAIVVPHDKVHPAGMQLFACSDIYQLELRELPAGVLVPRQH